MEHQVCPCCGRHCDLSMPRCARGVEYLRTGCVPEGRPDRKEDFKDRPRRKEGFGAQEDRQRGGDVNERLIRGLRDVSHLMRAQYEGRASQKRVLILLREAETMTQRDLTERMGIQPGSASELLFKLESAGLIARTQNAEDRRTTDIRLTDAGAALAAEAAGQRQRRHREMFACLSEEEKQTLLVLLEKLRADWEVRAGRDGRHGGRGGPHDPRGPHGGGRRHGGPGPCHDED